MTNAKTPQNGLRKQSKVLKIATAVLALGMLSATLDTASAQRHKRVSGGEALIGGIIGGVIGGALANSQPVYDEPRRNYRPRRVVRRSYSSHVDRCYAAYRSYDERTDTYVSYSGEVRRCLK